MTKKLLVDIGIAVNKNQSNQWWPRLYDLMFATERRGIVEIGKLLVAGSALTSWSKNQAASLGLKRGSHTDKNRNEVMHLFNETPADAIFWLDDDTSAPDGTIETLAALEQPIAAGIYFMRHPPCNPVAYRRTSNGLYQAMWDYQRGEILNVDSTGMGCTLVRREVYEEIRRQYVLFYRKETSTLIPVHRDDVQPLEKFDGQIQEWPGKTLVSSSGIVRLERLSGPVPNWSVERWPFYVMEYDRTEDHYFCEMAKRCGFNIVVDTGLECRHTGDTDIVWDNFRDMRDFYQVQREGEQDAGA